MALLVDPLLSESISNLTKLIVFIVKTTVDFKSELEQLHNTLQKIEGIIQEVEKLNQILDQPSNMYKDAIKDAKKLVPKCLKINWNPVKKFTHSLKLKDVNNRLLRFFQLEVQADQTRDIKQTLFEVTDVNQKMDKLLEMIYQTSGLSGYESKERVKLGWRVPILPEDIVGFDEPLKKLKVKVLGDESAVVVVADAGGCGKTTLSIMLCHDSEIRGKFGENVFFVTVSETPNFMVIVNNLLNPNSSGQPFPFQSDEDAKHELGNFLLEKASSPLLLVLDDVWDHSFISKFPLKIKGCKILVTSRTTSSSYDVFRFDPLSDEYAKILFCQSAFTESNKGSSPTIDEHLVDEIVKHCKKHPLTLTVVGRFLNGRDEFAWKSMRRNLSDGGLVDSKKEVFDCLERSFRTLDEELKECFMDFGLFLEDQRIPASVLLDMWVHSYDHDDGGEKTLEKIVELSFRNLVNLVATRKDSGATLNYCDQQFVTQHDLLRELAIHLSNKPEVAKRKRLIINAQGEYLPEKKLQVQEPMQARILSISTGESFASKWGDMKVPEVEIMVLNLKSKKYTLPHFIEEMQKLKILNVTNYGLYPTNIKNFDLLGCLSNLSRIRLERVAIPSMSTSILELKNLQKVSFIMCQIGNAFETELGNDDLKVWPSLVELEIDYCQELVGFPALLCSSVHIKTVSITNCNDMCEISEEFGKLTNLENLSLQSCTKLEKLPESLTTLQKLRILDISDCLSLSELPAQMGKLGGLRTIYMKGCTGISELPSSLEELSTTKVLCSEDIYNHWQEFHNVETKLVQENRLEVLYKITQV